MDIHFTIIIMSGVEDGTQLPFSTEADGDKYDDQWKLSIGRREDNHLRLRNDTFVSRQHAFLHWRNNQWWLEDNNSTNGTFLENEADFFNDIPVKGIVPIADGRMFRIGRTWLRLQTDQ
ncbi:FHA domain-containing protein [Phototrophicus methaneseepsis]|uniref:FHA domain-containing protein n=1 Tax=Phototrophicus methaneseepsis TaxID=2710758 RepID=A0A7S8E662_9CHLR|nr:FHA domain-containing protein [Phototrophicus methaneseepsis]QPC81008.1 FHA domain-containing protein [Phototrophicus methaneseepsis]